MAFKDDKAIGEVQQSAEVMHHNGNGVSAGIAHEQIITQDYIEINRIIPPDSAESQKLAGLMTSLAQKLLGNDYKEIKFLFSDTPDVNGGIITKANPPIVTTSKGLITGAKTVDEIAA